jgi:hypothetical protein
MFFQQDSATVHSGNNSVAALHDSFHDKINSTQFLSTGKFGTSGLPEKSTH